LKLNLIQRVNHASVSGCQSLSAVDPETEFPGIFTGLGELKGEYDITLKEDAKPFAIHVPRRIPIPLLPKVKEQLDGMLEHRVIEPVTETSEWCAPMVVVPKPNGDVRLCVDLTR